MKKGDWVRCLGGAPKWYKDKIGQIVWISPKGDVHAQFDGHEVRIAPQYVRIVREK
jgi:hypothetical protein